MGAGHTPVELVKTHQSLVREYFKYEEEKKSQVGLPPKGRHQKK